MPHKAERERFRRLMIRACPSTSGLSSVLGPYSVLRSANLTVASLPGLDVVRARNGIRACKPSSSTPEVLPLSAPLTSVHSRWCTLHKVLPVNAALMPPCSASIVRVSVVQRPYKIPPPVPGRSGRARGSGPRPGSLVPPPQPRLGTRLGTRLGCWFTILALRDIVRDIGDISTRTTTTSKLTLNYSCCAFYGSAVLNLETLLYQVIIN